MVPTPEDQSDYEPTALKCSNPNKRIASVWRKIKVKRRFATARYLRRRNQEKTWPPTKAISPYTTVRAMKISCSRRNPFSQSMSIWVRESARNCWFLKGSQLWRSHAAWCKNTTSMNLWESNLRQCWTGIFAICCGELRRFQKSWPLIGRNDHIYIFTFWYWSWEIVNISIWVIMIGW